MSISKQIKIKKKSKKEKGISLVGAIIAITIVAISVTAGLKFMSNAIEKTTVTRHRVIASFLAEEGLELVRNMVNTPKLKNSNAGFEALKELIGEDKNLYYENFSSRQTDKNALKNELKTYNIKSTLCNKPLNNEKGFTQCSISTQAYESGTITKDFFLRKIAIKTGNHDYDGDGTHDCPGGVYIESIVYWDEIWDTSTNLSDPDNPTQPYSTSASACIYDT
ncbi:MAG: hypothetical protein GF347_04015 [Candidatus Moranbacteria bacterium]|nr:hypothetical protein [Candidatus Moranbacteria bacterium]